MRRLAKISCGCCDCPAAGHGKIEIAAGRTEGGKFELFYRQNGKIAGGMSRNWELGSNDPDFKNLNEARNYLRQAYWSPITAKNGGWEFEELGNY